MRGLMIGFGIFLLAAGIGVGIWYYLNEKPEILIKGMIGSEKSSFLENEQVKAILKKKYGIVVDYIRAGSIEMVSEETKPISISCGLQVRLRLRYSKSSRVIKLSGRRIFSTPPSSFTAGTLSYIHW